MKKRAPLLAGLAVLLLYLGGIALLAIGRVGDNRPVLMAGMTVLLAALALMLLVLRRRGADAEPDAEPEPETPVPAEAAPAPAVPDAAAPDDLLVLTRFTRTTYQLVAGREALYFVQLGVDEDFSPKAMSRAVFACNGDDEAIRLQMDKGFYIPWQDIRHVSLRFSRSESRTFSSVGHADLTWRGGTERLVLVWRDTARDIPARITAFFQQASGPVDADTTRYDRANADARAEQELLRRRAEGRDEARLKKLLPLGVLLAILPLPIVLLWETFPRLYTPLAWLMLALAVLPIALIAAFPRYFSADLLLGLRKPGSAPWRKTVDLTCALSVSSYLMVMSAVVNYPFTNVGRAFTVALLFAFAFALVMTRPLRLLGLPRLWLRRGLLTVALLLLSLGVALTLNDVLDVHPVESFPVVVTDKRIQTGRNTAHMLALEGEDMPYTVTKTEYESVEPGDSVMFEEHTGAFGIRYTYLWTMDEWYAE